MTETNIVNCQRALISVSDKTGIVEFARDLQKLGIEIYSTGGTARQLADAGISVIDIAAYTAFPEMMDGRVKTLHPKIFGGILGRTHLPADQRSMQEHGIVSFQIVCVNLYPFAETIKRRDVSLEDAIENIDIGGPSLIRAAAKNHQHVAVLTSAHHYSELLEQLENHGGTTLEFRRRWMAQAIRHTAEYDTLIADFFARQWLTPAIETDLPAQIAIELELQQPLRHGENSHQAGGVYRHRAGEIPSVISAHQLNGKQLSYNNYLDMDAAWAIVQLQAQPACSVIKHNNPCGAAIDSLLVTACERAFAGDPQSAFGSVVAFNRVVDEGTARFLAENKNLFVEVILAPGFEPIALELLTTKPKWKSNVRLMSLEGTPPSQQSWEIRTINGGALVQSIDNQRDDQSQWRCVTAAPVSTELLSELAFGWDMVRFVKSNAITLSKDHSLIGVGAGQMSRVDSVKIAIAKAGERAAGSVLASDAFFPFEDSIPLAAAAGIAAIIQPGGSVNDDRVIAAANAANIPMIFTGRRQFRH